MSGRPSHGFLWAEYDSTLTHLPQLNQAHNAMVLTNEAGKRRCEQHTTSLVSVYLVLDDAFYNTNGL